MKRKPTRKRRGFSEEDFGVPEAELDFDDLIIGPGEDVTPQGNSKSKPSRRTRVAKPATAASCVEP